MTRHPRHDAGGEVLSDADLQATELALDLAQYREWMRPHREQQAARWAADDRRAALWKRYRGVIYAGITLLVLVFMMAFSLFGWELGRLAAHAVEPVACRPVRAGG